MYYIGFLKKDAQNAMVFKSLVRPKRDDLTYFVKVIGPYPVEAEAQRTLRDLKAVGWHENPAVSERQRKFMCSDLGRLRAGKKTVTGMREGQLRDFCRKSNPARISESQIKRGTIHELEHTTDRAIARKIACDHLREDPKYYSHLAKMEKKYKKNVMSVSKALRLTKKVIAYAKDVHKDYKENPGASYHDKKFIMYMRELEKYKLGSPPYIATLAKAYEHLESAKESMKQKDCV